MDLRSAAMPTCEGDANVRARSLTRTGYHLFAE